jgi:hypothetical protein
MPLMSCRLPGSPGHLASAEGAAGHRGRWQKLAQQDRAKIRALGARIRRVQAIPPAVQDGQGALGTVGRPSAIADGESCPATVNAQIASASTYFSGCRRPSTERWSGTLAIHSRRQQRVSPRRFTCKPPAAARSAEWNGWVTGASDDRATCRPVGHAATRSDHAAAGGRRIIAAGSSLLCMRLQGWPRQRG